MEANELNNLIGKLTNWQIGLYFFGNLVKISYLCPDE